MTRSTTEGIYRRLTVRMYGDARFLRLSAQQPSGQGLWVYLLTGPHTGPVPGLFVAGRAALAEALGWDAEAFSKAFQEVLGEGLAEFDERTRMCFIPNAIRHNMPPNPNVVKSWRASWLQLPECALRDRAFAHLQSALTEVSDAFGKAFAEACGKPFGNALGNGLANHCPKQEQEQEQEAGDERASLSSSPPVAPTRLPCPHGRIQALYNELLPELPEAKTWGADRERAARTRWSEIASHKGWTSQDDGVAWFRQFFEAVRVDDFLMGRTEPGKGHEGWRCDVDYLLSPKGFRRVFEGGRTQRRDAVGAPNPAGQPSAALPHPGYEDRSAALAAEAARDTAPAPALVKEKFAAAKALLAERGATGADAYRREAA